MSTPNPRFRSRPLALAALLCVSAAVAHAGGDAAVEQRLRSELGAVLTQLVHDGALAADSSLAIEAPARRVVDLGLLVDSAHAGADGLRVVAVTPDGSAQRMGLRSGDRLLGVNGESLAAADGAVRLRRYLDALPDGSALAFHVRRDGGEQTVSGALQGVHLPPMRLTLGDGALAAADPQAGGVPPHGVDTVTAGCGRISDFDVAPRQDDLHGAKIISIDGRLPGPSGSHSFRVYAGTHTVKVSEQIDSRYLAFSDRARNAGLVEKRYKSIDVYVAPDTTVMIAARLNEDRRNEPRDGAYWDPVAWKEKPEPCR